MRLPAGFLSIAKTRLVAACTARSPSLAARGFVRRQGRVLESLFADGFRHYIHLGAEGLRKAPFQLFKAPEIIDAARGKTFAGVGIRPGTGGRRRKP